MPTDLNIAKLLFMEMQKTLFWLYVCSKILTSTPTSFLSPALCPLHLEEEILVSSGIFITRENCKITSISRLIAKAVWKYTSHCSPWTTAQSSNLRMIGPWLAEYDQSIYNILTAWKEAGSIQGVKDSEEEAMMEAMVETDEDERPDDGKVEIPSEDEYCWLGIEQFHPPD